mmetsp:Transcript_27106/g.50580  ORF Transcript_27106/g.50580 Transcript_27106/m.50580 type:complete len:210 (-) Transcript_27106:88-717(-)
MSVSPLMSSAILRSSSMYTVSNHPWPKGGRVMGPNCPYFAPADVNLKLQRFALSSSTERVDITEKYPSSKPMRFCSLPSLTSMSWYAATYFLPKKPFLRNAKVSFSVVHSSFHLELNAFLAVTASAGFRSLISATSANTFAFCSGVCFAPSSRPVMESSNSFFVDAILFLSALAPPPPPKASANSRPRSKPSAALAATVTRGAALSFRG